MMEKKGACQFTEQTVKRQAEVEEEATFTRRAHPEFRQESERKIHILSSVSTLHKHKPELLGGTDNETIMP